MPVQKKKRSRTRDSENREIENVKAKGEGGNYEKKQARRLTRTLPPCLFARSKRIRLFKSEMRPRGKNVPHDRAKLGLD